MTKRYGDFSAVDDISLRVEEGSVFGFLGPNGAGKSTTIKLLMGLTSPSSGEGRVCGYDIIRESVKIRSVVGVLPDPIGFYENLTPRQTLTFFRQLRESYRSDSAISFWETEAILSQVGLKGWENKRIGTFSKGMKQRLGLAQALIHRPKLLLLDEPTSGLDPIGMNELHVLLKQLNNDLKVTIFLSTHILSTAEELCDTLGLIKEGRLVDSGEVRVLKTKYQTDSMQALFLKSFGATRDTSDSSESQPSNEPRQL